MKMHLKIDEKYRYDRNHHPEHYAFQALLPGLVTSKPWCSQVLAVVRDIAEQLTGGTYGLFVTRNPTTHERTGYHFGSHDPEVVRQVHAAFKQAVQRAGGTTP